jgi:mono/diheme cytochrome c family protein
MMASIRQHPGSRLPVGGLVPLAIVLAIVPALAGAGQVRAHDGTWSAPVHAASRMNPLAARTGAAAGGRKVFHERCSACHGEDGRGTSRAPDLSGRAVEAQSDGALFWKISGGNTRQGMPGFSFLPEAQRWQLILHLRAIATAATSARGSETPLY